ncbi:hypothetical protein [Halobacteriovorax sp. JY17]|uniref:hypothetical protein n=1 Tax=Halobacteriovorax sp. JY17 TaxID=2014617 RepID=UPI000C3EFCD3|nr:hypothetical protein [Halobacteriovorax sp. JY17]PIK16342.1 MAG: hypothetical protein CES88_06265 [Halobacteriovorax sp. JY17]
MNELNEMWEDNWKTGVIESSRRRYLLKELFPKISTNTDLLKYFILAHIYNLSTSELLYSEKNLLTAFQQGEFKEKELYLVCYFKEFFSDKFLELLDASINSELSNKWKFAELSKNFSSFSKNHWGELKKCLSHFQGVKAILLVRRDRKFKGRLVLLNDSGELVCENKKIWSVEALAKGRVNKKFFLPNGDTPTGFYSIDSVMPEADQQKLFGKHRRLKIDFVERKEIEENFSEILLEHSWWRSGVIASELSRSLLRIHGTGLKNRKIYSKYYPFVTTSGCISMREDRSIEGQRILLDKLMESLKLSPSIDNEVEIHGHLCVIELDDKSSKVTLKDIVELDQ